MYQHNGCAPEAITAFALTLSAVPQYIPAGWLLRLRVFQRQWCVEGQLSCLRKPLTLGHPELAKDLSGSVSAGMTVCADRVPLRREILPTSG